MTSLLVLTNYGLRYVGELLKVDALERRAAEADTSLLLDLYTGLTTPDRNDAIRQDLLARGLIERVADSVCRDDIELRYRRNPLEHVERIIFEFTTCCNFNCKHCYNAAVPRVIERDVAALQAAADRYSQSSARCFCVSSARRTAPG